MANLSVSTEDAHSQIRSLTQDVIQMEAELDRSMSLHNHYEVFC